MSSSIELAKSVVNQILVSSRPNGKKMLTKRNVGLMDLVCILNWWINGYLFVG